MIKRFVSAMSGLFLVFFLAGCVTDGLGLKVGGGDSGAASGSAGQSGSQGSVQLHRCPKPIATIAILKSGGQNQNIFVNWKIPADPLPAMRLIAQQTGCFRVVNRDAALQAAQTERALAASGQLKSGANMGKGQIVAADYSILVEVTSSDPNASGVNAGGIGSMFGMAGAIIGGLAGSVHTQEASVLLTTVDNRTTVQLSSASGKASAGSFNINGLLGGFGGSGGGVVSAGGYQNTEQGKVVIAAMVDAMNNLIPQIPPVKTP